MREARFYQTRGEVVQCSLCMHRCVIKSGHRGICGVRENRNGTLYTLVYGTIAAKQIDPVEKKPLFHFLPGTKTYSIATVGCNFTCLHCQNFSLSHAEIKEHSLFAVNMTPREVVQSALGGGCHSISYTYVEPTVFFEFAYDCCVEARKHSLKNIFVSNGYMGKEAARLLAPVLDGINIDIKSFREDFYREVCGARLSPVLDTVRYFCSQGVWVEVTTLLIPGLNDSDEEVRSIAKFIVEVDPTIAWHVSAFRPTHRMTDRPPTSKAQLDRARNIGLEEGLKHVYVGNIRGGDGENTRCQSCQKTVLKRNGFTLEENTLLSGACPHCLEKLAGVWE